ncbi:MAG TPA: DUF2207 domain-containing protein, partial [Xanthomonadaceae bacterium]|nr:DUF2207 domain-containing protein [Xanthomonadaceae bacterium]
MNHRGWFGIALVALLMLIAAPGARADERILDFHSDIAIADDGGVDVTETIQVRAEGDSIRHGIYREFPTRYEDRFGNNVVVDFKLLDTRRDGNAESARVEAKSNGVRIYLGNANTSLDPGTYTYVLHYRATRELGFFKDHDELYWNATGNDWIFPIDHAEVHVRLPTQVDAEKLQTLAFTGPQGARGTDWQAKVDGPGEASYSSTSVLPPHTGMTIVLMFPKGIIAEPSNGQRLLWLLADNAALLSGLLGLALLWIYYICIWRLAGRDPAPGVVIAQYDPPPNMSPAALRYIQRMGYDDRCFSADLVAMAVGGFLTIDHEQVLEDKWSLSRPSEAVKAPSDPAQRALGLGLLPVPGTVIDLKDVNAETIRAARTAHAACLKSQFEQRYFVTNSGTLLLGFALTVLAGLGIFVFGAGGGMPLGIALLVLMVATNVLFVGWMKAPTQSGRKLLDLADGLKLYLSVADRDELHALKLPDGPQPKLDADRYQALLPYALALGVEEAWTRKFTAAVGAAAAMQAANSVGWYSGNSGAPMNFS